MNLYDRGEKWYSKLNNYLKSMGWNPIKDTLKTAENLNAQISVKSVLNPLLWYLTPFDLICVIGLLIVRNLAIDIILVIILLLSLTTVIGCYIYFMINDPDRL